MKKRDETTTYPTRIGKDLLVKVNRARKKDGFTWPELTRKLLEFYLEARASKL